MTAGVAVEALSLTLGAFRLKKLDFSLSRGEILVILGPNGSGKSVTLETIAGFHRPDSGRVLIGGRDVSALPPERRKVGFVVQNFGLFPHLNVAHNVAIARRGAGKLAPHEAVLLLPSGRSQSAGHRDGTARLLCYFGIAHLAQRAPRDLSPGEKQRVALARALAGNPDLFLFDEPFAALDAETRDQLREELKSFLRRLAIPAIFVTHDHIDAMTLADSIVVLRDGAIVQNGTAAAIFRKPVCSFVARFVGVENILSARVLKISGAFATIAVGDRTLRTPALAGEAPSSIAVSIRAEDVLVTAPRRDEPAFSGINRLEGRVTGLRIVGPLVTVEIDCGFPLRAYLFVRQVRAMDLSDGTLVAVEIPPEAV
ncbi:MAG: ABC transporter ATP-binding protein, partial [Pseudomonadota bacterium]